VCALSTLCGLCALCGDQLTGVRSVAEAPRVKRHILLVGLPGCGKSTVGPIVAQALGARFVDVDALIAARAGMPVERIFGEQGEPAFRALEREAVLREISGEPAVIAPGGGWAAQPGNLAAADGHLTVYLKVTPEEAARRLATDGTVRPLLGGVDPLVGLEGLLKARRRFYVRCTAVVDTTGQDPETVARDILKLARTLGGW
jgi:shikimate kinase